MEKQLDNLTEYQNSVPTEFGPGVGTTKSEIMRYIMIMFIIIIKIMIYWLRSPQMRSSESRIKSKDKH